MFFNDILLILTTLLVITIFHSEQEGTMRVGILIKKDFSNFLLALKKIIIGIED